MSIVVQEIIGIYKQIWFVTVKIAQLFFKNPIEI